MIYCIPFFSYFPLNINALLDYYGIALGIFCSVYVYLDEKKSTKKEKIEKYLPFISLKHTANDDMLKITLKIKNNNNCYSNLSMYDSLVKEGFLEEKTNISLALSSKKKDDQNCIHSDIALSNLDVDGLPKYLEFFIDDRFGNTWECVFDKEEDENGKSAYYLKYSWLL